MNALVRQLRSKAAALHALADDLEAQADSVEALSASVSADWLSMKELTSEYQFTRESLAQAATNGLAVSKGAKGRIMVKRSDVETWLADRKWVPKKAKRVPKIVPGTESLADVHAQTARLLGVEG